ncbi:MAG: hypothetical protein NTV63_01830 [Candidatus Woesearchaeota archaeon]|nr:hypothetical protein [Candidatus Woesearchaeota archaeon]
MEENKIINLKEMSSETLDSLLCNACPINESPKECKRIFEFSRIEEYFNREEGEIKNMFCRRYICNYKLSKYRNEK